MPDTLPVHVNRTSLHSLEVPVSFETDGSFDVRLINHGEAIHVHLHLDDGLSELASVEANNHYVSAESERPVRVTVHERGATFGKLKVVTSYGAETRYVDIDLEEPEPGTDEVRVDESLAEPQPREVEEETSAPLADSRTIVDALAIVALVLAVGVAALVPSLPVRVGAALVFVAVLAGLVFTKVG